RGPDPHSLATALRLATEPGPWPVYSPNPWRKAEESLGLYECTAEWTQSTELHEYVPKDEAKRVHLCADDAPGVRSRCGHRGHVTFHEWRKLGESNLSDDNNPGPRSGPDEERDSRRMHSIPVTDLAAAAEGIEADARAPPAFQTGSVTTTDTASMWR